MLKLNCENYNEDYIEIDKMSDDYFFILIEDNGAKSEIVLSVDKIDIIIDKLNELKGVE